MQLSDVQSRFKTTVLGDHEAVGNDTEFQSQFIANDIDIQKRLHYYRDSVLEKLIKVLTITYPTVQILVGKEFFAQVARLYARQNPPESGNLNFYGEAFPKFLKDMEQTQSLSYLHDVALYDWLFNAAYYAPDDQPLDISTLDAETLPEQVLRLRSSAFLIDSDFPLTKIREFTANNDPDAQLDISSGGEKLLVDRPYLKVQVIALQDDEFIMLEAIQSGKTVSEVLEMTLNVHNDFDFQSFLNKFISFETFSSVSAN
ncbi:MAG: DNA-binding domain-containing protein [Pseudomonadota bacterium]